MSELEASHGGRGLQQHVNGMEVRKSRRLSEGPAMVWLEQSKWSKGRQGLFLKENAKKPELY